VNLKRIILIAIIALVAGPRPPLLAQTSLEPYQYVLALHKLQDQIVAGDKLAHEAQREMLVYMAGDFAKVRVADWQKKKNAEALLIYILSGGHPGVVEKLLAIKNQPNMPDGALAGALEFVMGNFSRARKLLKPVDPEKMSINAGSQIAIIKATLIADKNHKESLRLLSLVRLWKPGTLLEEAALRRALALASAKKEQKLFLQWSSQYVRRFEKSFYLPDFISKFSFYVTQMDFSTQPDMVAKVARVLSHLSKTQQASVYLTVARAAVLDGKNIQAELMANRALKLLEERPIYSARAKLYLSASQITTEKLPQSIALLTEVDRSVLEKQDRKIYDTVALMIEIIQKKPSSLAGQSNETKMPDAMRRKLGESQNGQNYPIVAKVRKLIKGANDLLEANK